MQVFGTDKAEFAVLAILQGPFKQPAFVYICPARYISRRVFTEPVAYTKV